MSELRLSPGELDYLLSPPAIRERAKRVHALALAGKTHFVLHEDKLPELSQYVVSVIRQNYPSLQIPFHSRWGHFRAGGVDRTKLLSDLFAGLDPLERARRELDLVIPSVLLDAGAGDAWVYKESTTNQVITRSEGLGVASFHMFLAGAFAGDKKSLRSDAKGLANATVADLRRYFQVSDSNPLVGVEGRVLLLQNLAKALENSTYFKDARPGNILDYCIARYGREIPASALLRAVLDALGVIWPGRLAAGTTNLGDVWHYEGFGETLGFNSLVPFHKLSQWLTYSLIEPIQAAGIAVTGVEGLTGLAEYRNGGLIVDGGLVSLRDPNLAARAWSPDSALVVEWRALTVHYLDAIAEQVREALNFTPQEFPLAKVLEGGTWWAGRFLARERRPGGGPPLSIASDGTVF